MCNTNTERVFETKFPGVVIDHKLTWKQHIGYIKGKISKSVAILCKFRDVLNSNTLRLDLLLTYFILHVLLCGTVWINP